MAEGDGEKQTTGAQSATPDVFISYASQDAAVANAVVSALERQGLKCLIAPRNVKPGTVYADAIVGAINESKALVLSAFRKCDGISACRKGNRAGRVQAQAAHRFSDRYHTIESGIGVFPIELAVDPRIGSRDAHGDSQPEGGG